MCIFITFFFYFLVCYSLRIVQQRFVLPSQHTKRMGNFLPWSSNARQFRRAIENNECARQSRFKLVRDKVHAYGQEPIERDRIHSLPLLQLQDELQRGALSATQVLYAYAHFALLVNDRLNCVAEILPEAFDEAAQLDAKYATGGDGTTTGKKKPPLFGLPFSVKANFFLKGYDCCIGLARRLGHPERDDCSLVTLLRQLGAVPFCYANVPQTLFSFVCSNPVYGTTLNPLDPNRTPGGSSGGDAALLAAGGTAFSTGGDIAGSLRIPALFCGLPTLKPGQNRFAITNAQPGMPGNARMGLGTGVYGKSMDELTMLLSNLIGNVEYHQNLVPASAPLPLDQEKMADFEAKAKAGQLRIGYHFDDGYLKPVPACARVVEQSVEMLRNAGNEMILFQIPEPNNAASIFYKNLLSEGGAYFKKIFAENPIDPYLRKQSYLLHIPHFVRWLLSFLLDVLSPQLAVIIRSDVRTSNDARQAHAELDHYIAKFNKYWLEQKLDALIVPAFPVPAVGHKWPCDLVACAFATGFYNMLDVPAGFVPTGTVQREDDDALVDDTQWATGSNILLKKMRSAASNSAGLPVGVQVVALRWEEEKCLGLMKAIETMTKQQHKDN